MGTIRLESDRWEYSYTTVRDKTQASPFPSAIKFRADFPSNDRQIIEIGKSYLATTENHYNLYGKKERMLVDVEASLTRDREANIDGKFGTVTFYKERDLIGEELPPILSARLCLPDSDFDALCTSLSQGCEGVTLTISVEHIEGSAETLNYGWEPDGSRLIWNVEESSSESVLTVKMIQFALANRVNEDVDSVLIRKFTTLGEQLRQMSVQLNYIRWSLVFIAFILFLEFIR